MVIEWSLPERHIVTAFTALAFEDYRIEPLRRITECLIGADCRQEFIHAVASRKLSAELQRLEEYDLQMGEPLRKATLNSTIRGEFCSSARRHCPWISEKIERRLFQFFCQKMTSSLEVFNTSTTLVALAMRYAHACDPDATDLDIERVYESYDGSVDTFVRAWSYAMMSYELKGRTVAHNDALDLHHFVYLREDAVLVTEEAGDKILPRVARGIGVPMRSIAQVLSGVHPG